MVHKFYAIKSERAIRPAIIISTVFAAIITTCAYFTGALTRFFPVAGELANDKRFDEIIPAVINAEDVMPEILVALILLLVLSASMSTLAGLVMISASALTVDLLKEK